MLLHLPLLPFGSMDICGFHLMGNEPPQPFFQTILHSYFILSLPLIIFYFDFKLFHKNHRELHLFHNGGPPFYKFRSNMTELCQRGTKKDVPLFCAQKRHANARNPRKDKSTPLRRTFVKLNGFHMKFGVFFCVHRLKISQSSDIQFFRIAVFRVFCSFHSTRKRDFDQYTPQTRHLQPGRLTFGNS